MGPRLYITVLLVACSALALARQATAACPATYGPSNGSLVMGDTYGACTSGCQPRNTVWGEICTLNPDAYSIWGVCQSWQRNNTQQLAASLFPGLSDFSPCQLYEAIGDNTLWIIGDSHVKGLWYTLRCFMIDLWDHAGGECAASNDTALQVQLELTSLQGHPYNTPPRCLHLIGSGGRICLVHSPIGDYYVSEDPQVPGTLQLLTQHFTTPNDIIYISIGRWHANNCEGIHPSYQTSLEKIGAFVQGNRQLLPNILFGVAPHDHTKCDGLNMTFNVPACLPADQGGYNISMTLQLPFIANQILAETYQIPIIDYYNLSLALHDGHITAPQSIGGVIDCLHFCRPGLGEINLWAIYNAILAVVPPSQPTPTNNPSSSSSSRSSSAARHVCVPIAPVLPKPFGPVVVGNGSSGPISSIQHAVARDAWGYVVPENR